MRDTVTIRRVAADAYSPAPRADLLRGVNRAVAEVLGSKARGAEIGVGEKGQVYLRGEGLSWEDRHAASARLRLIPGCSCVINTLESADSPALSATAPRLMPSVAAKPLSASRTTVNSTAKPVIERTAWVSPYTGQGEATVKSAANSTNSNQPAPSRFTHPAVSPYGGSPPAGTAAKERSMRTPALVSSVSSGSEESAPEYVSVDVSAPAPGVRRTFSKPASESVIVEERPAPRGLFTLFQRTAPAKVTPMPMARAGVKSRVYMSPSMPADSAGHTKAVSLTAEEESGTLAPEHGFSSGAADVGGR